MKTIYWIVTIVVTMVRLNDMVSAVATTACIYITIHFYIFCTQGRRVTFSDKLCVVQLVLYLVILVGRQTRHVV